MLYGPRALHRKAVRNAAIRRFADESVAGSPPNMRRGLKETGAIAGRDAKRSSTALGRGRRVVRPKQMVAACLGMPRRGINALVG